MADEGNRSYPIGYKRPPRATQFKPGQSGNSKGRPKGAKNFATVINDELKVRIAVTENGKRRTISKRQAVAKQLVNKAAAGDPKAIPLLLSEARLAESLTAEGLGQPSPDCPEDQLVMASIRTRIRQTEELVPPETASDDLAKPSVRRLTDSEPKTEK